MLLFLAVSSNYVGELLPCKLQKFLNTSMLGKHYIVLLLIYFTITYPDSLKFEPKVYMLKTLMIWILFLIFSKMDLTFSVAGLLLLGAIYLFYTFDQNEKVSPKQKQLYRQLKQISSVLLVILVIIGHSLYFLKQYKDHAHHWSYTKFIFGVPKCANA